MRSSLGSATGKIILSGEYAVLFGHPGIAMPSKEKLTARFQKKRSGGLTVIWGTDTLDPAWAAYAGRAAEIAAEFAGQIPLHGELMIETDLPLGKGMGSSTAVVIAVTRAIVGRDAKDVAWAVEETMNPGGSGVDFETIWRGTPILFRKGEEPREILLPQDLLQKIRLEDSGTPSEPTPSLVRWMTERKDEVKDPIAAIGACTERILKGEALADVIRDHHRAQVALGVVPRHAREMIETLEKRGYAAKITGAGGRSGGGGMIVAVSR